MWRVYVFSGLIACVAGAVTAFATVQLIKPAVPQTVSTLGGEEHLEFGSEKVVYYKTPFASPPYLTVTSGANGGYSITDQKAESFKLRRATPGEVAVKFEWKAEGQPSK